MVMGGFSAAAAMVATPAFARPEDYAGSADKKRLAKEAAEKAKLGENYVSPYNQIMARSSEREAAEAKAFAEATKGATFSLNGKDENGVSFRKPSDPNACSPECKAKRLAKYGY